ncbi:MAG: ABC transporter permease [Chloroflexi bacterium]|nr:ABC transporter permease [Chloroflexota bacterium]
MTTKGLEAATGQRGGGRGLWVQAAKRLLRKKVALVSLGIIAALYLGGILAPLISPYGYNAQDLSNTLKSPSFAHWLGTDRLGRDQLTRILWGLQTTVIITIATAVTGGLLLGIVVGLLSGYKGGMTDAFFMRVGEIFMAFPGILLVILMAATLKPRVLEMVRSFEDATGIGGIARSGFVDYFVIFGALAVFGWVGMARLVRGQVLSLKEDQFVEAARSMGASTWRVILVHLLPNALPPVIVSVSMGMAGIAGSEIVLSWLGIGIQPPRPSLGLMIFDNGNISVLRTHPYLLLAPVTVVALFIFAWNLLGDALNDVLNPRARSCPELSIR